MERQKTSHLRLVKSGGVSAEGPLHRLGLENRFRPVNRRFLAISITGKILLLSAILYYILRISYSV